MRPFLSRAAVAAAGCVVGVISASGPAHAQSLPLPLPPLPLPPLPFPETGAGSPSAERDTSEATKHGSASHSFEGMLRLSDSGARDALRRSRFHEDWYGWQTLAVDASAVGVILLAAATMPTPPRGSAPTSHPIPVAFGTASGSLYGVGPAVVHVVHGNPWRAFGSFGLRVLLPLLGFGAGYFAFSPSHSVTNGAVAAAVGGVSASAIDAGALAWDRWYGDQPRAFLSLRGLL
jgi:hypothetical protein